MAHFLHHDVPGVFIPEPIMKRMEVAQENGNEEEEGIQIALELMEKIRATGMINGFHIMTMRWEEVIPRVVVEAGLIEAKFAKVSNQQTRNEADLVLQVPQL